MVHSFSICACYPEALGTHPTKSNTPNNPSNCSMLRSIGALVSRTGKCLLDLQQSTLQAVSHFTARVAIHRRRSHHRPPTATSRRQPPTTGGHRQPAGTSSHQSPAAASHRRPPATNLGHLSHIQLVDVLATNSHQPTAATRRTRPRATNSRQHPPATARHQQTTANTSHRQPPATRGQWSPAATIHLQTANRP